MAETLSVPSFRLVTPQGDEQSSNNLQKVRREEGTEQDMERHSNQPSNSRKSGRIQQWASQWLCTFTLFLSFSAETTSENWFLFTPDVSKMSTMFTVFTAPKFEGHVTGTYNFIGKNMEYEDMVHYLSYISIGNCHEDMLETMNQSNHCLTSEVLILTYILL